MTMTDKVIHYLSLFYEDLILEKIIWPFQQNIWGFINFIELFRWQQCPPIMHPRNPKIIYVGYCGDTELGGWAIEDELFQFIGILWEEFGEHVGIEFTDEDFMSRFYEQVTIKRIGPARSRRAGTRFDPRLKEDTCQTVAKFVAVISNKRIYGWQSGWGRKDFKKAVLDKLLYQGVPFNDFMGILQNLVILKNKESVLKRNDIDTYDEVDYS